MKFRWIVSWIVLGSLLTLAIAGCSTLGANNTDTVQASGVIEATEIAVSPELSGRVVQVSVQEGDKVKSGDELFRLDDSLLQAQKKVASAALDAARNAVQTAQANLDSAKAQYQMVLDAAQTANQEARSNVWSNNSSSVYKLPTWYFTQSEQVKAAQSEIDAAQIALDGAQSNLEKVVNNLENADFLDAEERLAEARATFEVVDEVQSRAQGSSVVELRDAAKNDYDDAKDELDRAQQAYDDMLTTQAAKDVLKARAERSVAQERVDTAQDQLRALQTGELAPQVVATQKVVQQAEDELQQAQTGVTQAEAQLGLIDAQMEKLVVSAPVDGVILSRSVQSGEVVQTGTTALTIGKLDNLKVTVYLPEDRYGQVNLGDHANLSVDSFPNETFDAVVSRIADQAEYTPRNVQTKEERQTTVYAVELSIVDPQGKLIPGMPTDVIFPQ